MDRSPLAWVLGALALALATVLRVASIEDGHTTAFLIGSALGSVVASLLIALLLRFAYVRLIRKGRPLWSAWVLVIAAVISVLVAASRVGRDAEQAAGAKESCGAVRTAEQLVGALPDTWRSLPSDPELARSFSSRMPQEEIGEVTARSVGRGGEPVGAVVVVELRRPGSREELIAGFSEGADGKVEDAALGSARGKLYRAPDGGATLVGMSDRCAAAFVIGVSPRTTTGIAGDLPVEPS